MSPYNVSFGSGIRANLKMSLRDAQEREGIITSLLPRAKPLTADEARADLRARNAKIINEFQKALFKSGLSPKTVEQHVSNIATFADAYLLEQDPPRPLLTLDVGDVEAWLRGLALTEARAASKSFQRFVRFLWDSGRSHPEALYALQDFLKSYQREM